MMARPRKGMCVMLAHAPNPDIGGGYWEDVYDDGKMQFVKVKDYAEASLVCRDFISRNGLGAGNWIGGEVYMNDKPVAYVSYNGRVWEGTAERNWKSDMPDPKVLYEPKKAEV